MTVLDSSVLIADFVGTDTKHREARKVMDGLTHIACPEYVILEVVTVLRNKREEETARRFLELIENASDITFVPITPALFWETAALFKGGLYRRLSFVDTALLVLSRKHEVVTFDKTLASAIKTYGGLL